MNKLLIALIISRNKFLLLKTNAKNHWEFPYIKMKGDEQEKEALKRGIQSLLGIDILPYIKIDGYNHAYPGSPIVIYKCSILSSREDIRVKSDYSDYMWVYVLKTMHLTFSSLFIDLITYLINDEHVFPIKTIGPGSPEGGFASMSLEKRRMIAGMGGTAAHKLGKAHRWTKEEAKIAGKKGGGRRKG